MVVNSGTKERDTENLPAGRAAKNSLRDFMALQGKQKALTTENYPSPSFIVRRNLNRNPVADHYLDKVYSHFPGKVRQHLFAVLKSHFEKSVWQSLRNHSVNANSFLICHKLMVRKSHHKRLFHYSKNTHKMQVF